MATENEFSYTSESGKSLKIDKDPMELIAMRFQDPPVSWYDGADKEKKTIARMEAISWPRLTNLRRSPEFKLACETFLEKNGHEVTDENIDKAGWLPEKRTNAKRHPDAEKITVWGKIVSETDEEIVVQKLPDLEDEHKGKSRGDLIAQIEEMKAAMGVKGEAEVADDDVPEASQGVEGKDGPVSPPGVQGKKSEKGIRGKTGVEGNIGS